MPINSIITIDFSNTDIIVKDDALTKCTGSIYFTSISTDYSCNKYIIFFRMFMYIKYLYNNYFK